MRPKALAPEEVFTESGAPWVTQVLLLQNVTCCSSPFPLNYFPLLTCRASSFAETDTDLNWWWFLPNMQALFCYILEFGEVHVSGICLPQETPVLRPKASPPPPTPSAWNAQKLFSF